MIKKIDNTGRIAYTKQGDVIYNTSNNQLELFDNGEFKQILTSGSTALNSKQDTLVSGTNIKTVEGQSILGSGNIDITKTDVGLGNVDNTSDINKPVSNATQTALNGKQNTLVSGTNIKSINGNTLLGSGDITISGGVTSVNGQTGAVTTKTINGNVLTGTGNIVISGGGVSQNYSTTEQALLNSNGTPLLWTNGKQVYQKSYRFVSSIIPTITDSLGIDELISIVGWNYANPQWNPLWGTTHGQNNTIYSVFGDLYIDTGGGARTFTIQYTKI